MVDQRLLQTVRFKNIVQWDTKCFFGTNISSKYKVERLGKYIDRNIKKVKLFDYPETEFHILGISNEIGMFDAYSQLGKNINQPYILVDNYDIAYNPYRINVGSIGLKTEALKHQYISPAYMVFSCKKGLLPEYLFCVMKTEIFNKQVRENTTGSVRQTLSFDRLSMIQIPIPDSINEQRRLVDQYDVLVSEAKRAEEEADELEEKIESFLFGILDIKVPELKQNRHSLLDTARFKEMFKWGVEFGLQPVTPNNVFHSNKYENIPITDLYDINPATKYPKEIEDIAFIPMECISDVYGEITNWRAGKTAAVKGYSKFQEGDVLWAKITPCMQNGKCAVAKKLQNGYGYGSTEYHIFRTKNKKAIPEYVYCFLRTKTLRNVAKKYFTGSSGQQRVGADFVEMLTLPMLPVSSADSGVLTQQTIVNEIFALKDKIKILHQRAENLREKAYQEFRKEIFDE